MCEALSAYIKRIYIYYIYSYGSVGAICGHEMTHGFDDVGREYDAAGNRNAWWTPQVRFSLV